MLVIIGIIEFGLVFKDQLAVTSAVRAGARIASAEPRSATFATDAAVAGGPRGIGARHDRRAGALGLSGRRVRAPGRRRRHVQLVRDQLRAVLLERGASRSCRPADRGTRPAQNACQGTQDSVGVYLSFKHPGVTQAFFNSLGLSQLHRDALRADSRASQSGGCK